MASILIKRYRPSQATVERLCKHMDEELKVTKYRGQNISLWIRDIKEDLREIYMNVDSSHPIPGLVKKALSGLTHCTDPMVNLKVRQLRLESNQAGFGQAASAATPYSVLDKVENMYLTLRDQNDYGPATEIQAQQAAAAFQATVQQAVQQHLQQDRSARSTGSTGTQNTQRTCWDCGSTSHLRGDPNCPHTNAQASTTSTGTPAQASAESKNQRRGKAMRDLLQSLRPFDQVPDSRCIDFVFEGRTEGKVCLKCKRVLRGARAHYTKDHIVGFSTGSGGQALLEGRVLEGVPALRLEGHRLGILLPKPMLVIPAQHLWLQLPPRHMEGP